MKKIWLLILLAIFCGEAYADPPPTADPKWFVCAADHDCVIVRGVCSWTAANKEFAAVAEKYFVGMMPVVKCALGGYPEPKPATICQEQKCGIEFKDASGPKSAAFDRAAAVRLAEKFVTENGYTDAPADKTHLQLELLDSNRPIKDILAQRHNSLKKKAYGILFGRKGGSPGWTVVFRFSRGDNENGRAVTMDLDGGNLKIEHVDIFLKAVKEIREK